MNETEQTKEKLRNRPVVSLQDGMIGMKSWRNVSEETGKANYRIKIEKSYRDSQSGEMKTTQTFTQADLLKIQTMGPDMYRAINREREHDRRQSAERETKALQERTGLEKQRDAAIGNTEPSQKKSAPAQEQNRTPPHSPTQ